MAFKLTWYGHAAFAMEIDGAQVLLDPFLSDNPTTEIDMNELPADFIIISHGHGDHVGDALAIAKRTGATVICNFEIGNWMEEQGVEKIHRQHIGGGFTHPFGYLKLTIAHHGSALPDGSYGGNPAGVLITTHDGKKIWPCCPSVTTLPWDPMTRFGRSRC
jgi:L-ascorbate metabolism protein UlaG (beta-lactamase superfamily)